MAIWLIILMSQVLDGFWLLLPLKFNRSIVKPESNPYHKEKTHPVTHLLVLMGLVILEGAGHHSHV